MDLDKFFYFCFFYFKFFYFYLLIKYWIIKVDFAIQDDFYDYRPTSSIMNNLYYYLGIHLGINFMLVSFNFLKLFIRKYFINFLNELIRDLLKILLCFLPLLTTFTIIFNQYEIYIKNNSN